MASQGRAGGPEPTLSRMSGRVPSDRGTTRNVSASPMISGQRLIAVHALENLATSDTGIAILRRTLREQNQASERRPRSDRMWFGRCSSTKKYRRMRGTRSCRPPRHRCFKGRRYEGEIEDDGWRFELGSCRRFCCLDRKKRPCAMRTNAGYGMAGNPRDMITLADRRFPVRIRIGVPSGGLVSVMPK